GCSTQNNPPPNVLSIPLYPGAQHGQTIDTSPAWPTGVVSFQSGDKPEAVLAFYRDVLIQQGWILDTSITPDPHRLSFVWSGAEGYYAWIIARLTSNGQTSGELTLVNRNR